MTSSQAKQIAEQYLSWLGASTPHAAAKLEAMIEEALEGQWLPIETAPKDGTNIMLGHKWAVFDGWWHEETGGWVDGELNMFDDYTTYVPTHWRPLPPNPKD